jgi:hypothetical protein
VLYVKISPPWEVKRTVIKKCEEATDPKYGNKPAGPSSHEVTAWAKKILEVEHAGHGGTLEAVSAGKIP